MPTRRITRVSIAYRLAVLGTLAVMVHVALADAVGRAQVCVGNVGVAAGRERIEGVISETRDVAGKSYARISVGSDDAVRRKMRLSVVSRRGEVLGYITVTAVEPE